MSTLPDFHLFLPQMRLSFEQMVERAGAAEAAGFGGLALMDHLAPPMAEQHPMHDAMVTAAWLLAHTETLRIGHLVLCDSFRHPAVLAKQAVSLDHASGGRFELGLGWGSVPAELARFGIGSEVASERVDRLSETLEVLGRLWEGDPVTYHGAHHRLSEAHQQPRPIGDLPVVIGGAGPRTMELAALHATWWNCPIYALDRFDDLRPRAGPARPSIQQMVAFVPEEDRRDEVEGVARRRFGGMGDGLVVGDAAELSQHFTALADRGVERCYVWFSDFADPDTLARFGAAVIRTL